MMENLGENEHGLSMNTKPFISMEFASEEDAYNFYNEYGRYTGFSVRKATTRINKEKILVGRMFVCSKEGERVKRNPENTSYSKEESSHTRCGCKAFMEIKLQGEGTWKVIKFVEEHNHEVVTPTKRNMLRSQKKLSKSTVNLIKQFDESGIKARNIYDIFAQQSKGYENVPVSQDSIRRQIREHAKHVYGDDANLLYSYFQRKKEENSEFIYHIQFAEGGQVLNCFWVDARARVDYHHFGDVVVFDTTYKTNKYLMPFCPFTGVNNHRQSIMLGCALLVDETTTSFEWVFSKWLEAMNNCHPQAIITDQDERMGTAIAKIFPYTCHRLCMWHIMQKVPEKVPRRVYEIGPFEKDLEKCLYHSFTPEEFEASWEEMNAKYNVSEVKWISYMYEIREKWMPAYFRKTFLAGMSTTQRSESMNKLFKGYVDKYTPLSKFVLQYEKALDYRRTKENRQDFETMNGTPVCKTTSLIEKHMADVFTKKIFKSFQKEFFESFSYMCKVTRQYEDTLQYEVCPHKTGERNILVTYIASEEKASCLCAKFEFEGIVCRHIFAVISNRVMNLPSHYILARWTRHAKQEVQVSTHGVDIRSHNEKKFTLVRYNELCTHLNRIASKASMYENSFRLAIKGFGRLELNIDKSNNEEAEKLEINGLNIDLEEVESVQNEENNIGSQVTSSSNTSSLKPPPIVRTKGSGKRFVSAREQRRHWQRKSNSSLELNAGKEPSDGSKAPRKCHNCDGCGHDARNCPSKKPRLSSDIEAS